MQHVPLAAFAAANAAADAAAEPAANAAADAAAQPAADAAKPFGNRSVDGASSSPQGLCLRFLAPT